MSKSKIPFSSKKDKNYGHSKTFNKKMQTEKSISVGKELEKSHEQMRRKRLEELKERMKVASKRSNDGLYMSTDSQRLSKDSFMGFQKEKNVAFDPKEEVLSTSTVPMKKIDMKMQQEEKQIAAVDEDNNVVCPGCGALFELTPEILGILAECSECDTEFYVPDLEKEAEEERKAKELEETANIVLHELKRCERRAKEKKYGFEWMN
ncbi:MAG: hypothetical protein U9O87_10865 [Verrucomicrobiota bacterium]|nr:hypothetical protein [Verrucomicrobiota bacterium]